MKQAQELKELKAKDTKDLYQEIHEAGKHITEIKFKAAFRKVKNYKEIRHLRRKVAQIWTILAERALADLAKDAERPKKASIQEVKNAK